MPALRYVALHAENAPEVHMLIETGAWSALYIAAPNLESGVLGTGETLSGAEYTDFLRTEQRVIAIHIVIAAAIGSVSVCASKQCTRSDLLERAVVHE